MQATENKNVAISVNRTWVAELDKQMFYGNAVSDQIAVCQVVLH